MDMSGFGGLLAFVLGWLVAQTGKLLGDLVSMKKMTFKQAIECFTRSGGMPSGHTASFTGLTVYFIIKNGIFANITVLALAMTIIVVYDAVNVRYAVGEQGKLLNVIAQDKNHKSKKLRIVEGHTIPQVCVGAVIGVMIGLFCGFVL
jgi:acid phosphatase family membrane protein YuiD